MTDHSLTTGLVTSEKRTVRGGVKNGRRPYVQIDGVHYTNPVLGDTGELIGTILIVQIDEDDTLLWLVRLCWVVDRNI